MRIFLWLLVVVALVWLFRSSRRKSDRHGGDSPPQQQSRDEAAKMIACDVCGIHIPLAESVPGKRGNYCCSSHFRQAES
ncbi:MAG: PP0621 family protein [Rhodoferax sp.]